MQIQSTTELFDLGVMKLANYQTSDFFLVDSIFTLNATSFLLTFKIDSFFSKISLISGISSVFSRIWDISAKLRKTAHFSDFNIRSWLSTTNCKLNKRCECHARFRSIVIELRPNVSELYYNRGICHYYLHNYYSAIDDFTTALVDTPEDSEYLFARSMSFVASN